MNKKVTLTVEITQICYPDQEEFCKEEVEQLLYHATRMGDYEIKVEDTDEEVYDFYRELKEEYDDEL